MANRFMNDLRDNAVVVCKDGYRRVFIGDIPLGRRIQAPGKQCKRGKHEFVYQTYPRCWDREYTDKVCVNCPRRIPLSDRQVAQLNLVGSNKAENALSS